MENYTIAESCTLPSLGKVYGTPVNPEITIRSMTTEEEQKRLSISDYPYKMLCEIIDDCIVDGAGISSYDMCVGDYQYLLHKLRVATYGPEYTVSIQCPYCGYQSAETVNLDELYVFTYDDEFEKYREFDLPASKKHIRLTVQTPRMLDNITIRVKDFKKKNPSSKKDPTLTYTIAALIDTIDGERPDKFKLEEWVANLPMRDANTIITYAEKLNSLLGVDTQMICTCDICGLPHETALRATREFFRPALNI